MSNLVSVLTLDKVANIFNGNSIPEKVKSDQFLGLQEGTSYIGTKDVGFDGLINYSNGVKIPENKAGQFRLALAGSTLVCGEGGSAGKKIAFNTQNTFFGNKLYAITPNPSIHERYIFYFTHSPSFKSQFKARMSGIIGGVSIGDFKKINISIPLFSEQERIVNKLDHAFANINKALIDVDASINSNRTLFKSYLTDLFENGNQIWPHKSLKDISIEFGRGKSKHRPRNDPLLYGGKYPFIQTGEVRNSDRVISTFTQSYSEKGLAQSKLWPKETICITIAANIAEIGILGLDACFPDSIIGIVVDPKHANSEYVYYMLLSLQALLKSKGKGSAQDNINLGTFENMTFPFPSLAEQLIAVDKLVTLSIESNSLETIYTKKKNALLSLKESLLREAFPITSSTYAT